MNTKLNKSDFTLLIVYFSAASLLNALDYKSQKSELIEYIIDIPSTIIFSLCVIFIFMYILIPKFIIESKNYISFILLSVLTLVFFGTIDDTLGFVSGGNPLHKLPNWDRIMINGIYTAANNTGLIFGILFTKKFYEGRNQFLDIEKQQKENELKLLRSQIDPHFLFNNLNTLDSLIESDTEKAKEYINRLSLIYRYLIQTKDAEVMELSKELQFAENYIFLMKTRFGSDYEFTIEKNTILLDKFIPTGAIQALLENVVKHNKSEDKIPVKTTILINDGWLIITNSKSNSNSNQESFGTGLENLKARYKLLSDQQIQIHNMDKKFEVFIPIITLSE